MAAAPNRALGYAYVVLWYVAAGMVAYAVARAFAGRHPLLIAATADVAATAVVFAASVLLDNSSAYDAYWSVAPFPIAAYWASQGDHLGARQLAILGLVAVWGLRLTANWTRRWRGPEDEDFRYVEIRGKTGFGYWPASFFAIHLLPTVWVFLGLLPLYPALTRAGLGVLDGVATVVTAVAIAIEALSDRQLHAYRRAPHPPAGVLSTGLWRHCRHPNYLGEVLFWWGLYLFGVASAPSWAWTIVGPLSITMLFVFVSVPWMDRRMAERHPAWSDRMRATPGLVPWRRRSRCS